MRAFKNGILLTGGEISALLAFAGKDPTQEKLWGCVLKTTTLSIVASASNGMAGLLGVDTGRHDLPPGNWFVKRSDLEKLKKLTSGGGMAICLISSSGGMRSCQLATADKETSRIVEGGFWTFQDPADQLSLFPLETVEGAARLPDGGVRSQAFLGPVLSLVKDLTDASGNDTVEPHYPASPLEPMVVRSTAPGDGGTEWRAVFMPRRTEEDGAPVREPEDVSGYRLEPVESKGVRAANRKLMKTVAKRGFTSISLQVPGEEKVTITSDQAREFLRNHPQPDDDPDEDTDPADPEDYGPEITDSSDMTAEEAVEHPEADEHWEPGEDSQVAPQPAARRRPSRPSKVPERAKSKAKSGGRGKRK